jgi:hypothetical protein
LIDNPDGMDIDARLWRSFNRGGRGIALRPGRQPPAHHPARALAADPRPGTGAGRHPVRPDQPTGRPQPGRPGGARPGAPGPHRVRPREQAGPARRPRRLGRAHHRRPARRRARPAPRDHPGLPGHPPVDRRHHQRKLRRRAAHRTRRRADRRRVPARGRGAAGNPAADPAHRARRGRPTRRPPARPPRPARPLRTGRRALRVLPPPPLRARVRRVHRLLPRGRLQPRHRPGSQRHLSAWPRRSGPRGDRRVRLLPGAIPGWCPVRPRRRPSARTPGRVGSR